MPQSVYDWLDTLASMEHNYREIQPLNDRAISGFHWDYEDQSMWNDYYGACNGMEQSPIDLPPVSHVYHGQSDISSDIAYVSTETQGVDTGHAYKYSVSFICFFWVSFN